MSVETAATNTEAAEHHHDEHNDHGEFIAHHFESAEQQFDSGKLGIWIFLTTEILFFSGLFLAYTLWRYHQPDLFVEAHHFLDKVLGGINTIVLLFSSLTMAWAVRESQFGKNGLAARLILITMVCAAVFLGIKAVEYSHKWDLNIYPIAYFNYIEGYHPTETGMFGLSKYLIGLSVVPAILLVGFAIAAVVARGSGKKLLFTFFAGLAIMMGGYFLGVVGGQLYMNATEGGTGTAATSHDDHGTGGEGDHGESADPEMVTAPDKYPPAVGVFFSIYYCMTGLHALHVIGGMAALSWLFYRCLSQHFRPDYFGPVDFVGLYWHLVDLIWIFLFPLLYLIK